MLGYVVAPPMRKRSRKKCVPHGTVCIFRVSAISGTVERRRERQITQKLCDYICKAEGLNYCESGLCWSKSLRHPAVDIFKASRYDWAHSCLQDGCFSKEAHLYISSSGADYKDVEQYFRLAWQFPHKHQHKGNALWREKQSLAKKHRSQTKTRSLWPLEV